MFTIRKMAAVVLLIFFMVGCGSNNSDSTQSVIISEAGATVVLLETSGTITANNELMNIVVTVIDASNSPYTDGNVTVVYPDDIREGRDIGSFATSSVAVTDGKANFIYTAPNDIGVNTEDIVFGFYHSENTSQVQQYTVKIVANPDVTLVLGETIATVTTNSEVVDINTTIIDSLNSPYQNGSVTVLYPDDIRDGRDVGSFLSSTVNVTNGYANFTYTAPQNLSQNTEDLVFNFYHSGNPSDIKELTIKIAAAQVIDTTTTYSANASSADENYFIPLETTELYSFFVMDDKNLLLEDSSIISIKVEVLNPNLGSLVDSDGNTGTTLTLYNKNSVPLNIVTKTVSGVLPLNVEIKFRDSNNETQTIADIFNIVVLSGPPSAISLSYAGTSLEKQTFAKFVENWVVTVTDRYNNLVNTNPSVSMGMMAGYAQDSSNTAANNTNFLYFPPSTGQGTISGVTNTFTTTQSVFSDVDQTNNYLVTFGDGYTYNVSGKWSVNTNSGTRLDLVDEYSGDTISGLGFAVGNNFRQDRTYEGVEWIGNVYPEEDGNFTIPSTGSMRISVEFDYYLTGKDVMLWVNLIGKNYLDDTTVRIGEAQKVTLRGNGLEPYVDSYVVPAGATNQGYRFTMRISDTGEPYRHANFGVGFQTSGEVSINSVSYSDTTANVAYVDVFVTNSDSEAAGSVSVERPLVSREF